MHNSLTISPSPIDSASVGDPTRFLSEAELEQRLIQNQPDPKDGGQLALLIRRGDGGLRQRVDRVCLDPVSGFPGDAWGRKSDPKLHSQITVMQLSVAEMLANGQPLELFGDNLFVHLDLSAMSLPPLSRIRIGSAIVEVTEKPHTGCNKFEARFGLAARSFTLRPDIRPLNLRGIHVQVVEAGDVFVGCLIEVLRRGTAG
ncbi:MAG: hypothetical protein HUU55_23530 [Myxococcales bacterium]|nr:hypothetical protein [Myxococcales bacterium]